jgi:hypothetical protein
MFSPMIAGLIVCLSRDIKLSAVGLRGGRLGWLAIAAVIALPLIGLTLVFAFAVPGVTFDPNATPIPALELPPGLLGVAVAVGLALVLGAMHRVGEG